MPHEAPAVNSAGGSAQTERVGDGFVERQDRTDGSKRGAHPERKWTRPPCPFSVPFIAAPEVQKALQNTAGDIHSFSGHPSTGILEEQCVNSGGGDASSREKAIKSSASVEPRCSDRTFPTRRGMHDGESSHPDSSSASGPVGQVSVPDRCRGADGRESAGGDEQDHLARPVLI